MTKTNIKEILDTAGVFVSTTSGISMMPMLRDRRDTVIVKPATGRLKKYDVALYARGDSYVLHRVIKVLPDSYIIRGDNCIAKEYGITDDDILGVLVEFYRKDKRISVNKRTYRAYSAFICAVHPFVTLKLNVKAALCSVFRKRNRT